MEYITILGFSFFGISMFLALFYSLRFGLKDDGYLFLYFLLLLLSYELFYKTLIHSRLIYSFPSLYISGRFFNLMVYPVLLFFIFSITKSNFRLRTKHWTLIGTTLIFVFFNYLPALNLSLNQKIENLNLFYADTRPGSFNYWSNWLTLLKGTIIPLVFVGIAIYEFYNFKRRIRSVSKQTLLNFLLTVIILIFLFSLFSNFIYERIGRISGWSMIEWPVDIVFLSLIITFLSFIALSVNSGHTFLPPSRYASSALNEESYNEIVSQISALIKEEELYKHFDISLKQLAKELNSNTRYISQAINHGLDMGFNDFVNQFRVEEAKEQLVSPKNKHLTIEAIVEQCGFQSKSTFFRAFKKATGVTPKQFINTQKKS